MRTMTDPRCGKVSRANDQDGHCTNCHRTWSGETAFTAHQHLDDGKLTCEDPETATKPNGDQKWWPRERPGTTDGVAWGLGEPGWSGVRGTGVPLVADSARVHELLSDVYTDEGVQIWLQARNDLLGGERPLDLIRNHRTDEVIQVVEQLRHGAAS